MATNKATRLKIVSWMLTACLLWILVGCGSEPSEPRTRDQIFQELQSLPVLYWTGKTKSEVIAPGNKGNFVDEDTHEICWRVMECGNPACPGRGADGKPLKFITPDPAMYAKPDGTFGYDQKKSKEAEKMAGGACPECLQKRNLKTESEADRNRYAKWRKPHVLPESSKRKEELELELEQTKE